MNESTLFKEHLKWLKKFYHPGHFWQCGPQVYMIDDSSSERAAINKAWPSAVVLLCTFHFLQRRWTWLQDGQIKVDKNDRLILIEKLKSMVCKQ